MALLGKIDSFNHSSDDICEYIERVGQYFFANDINDGKERDCNIFNSQWEWHL